MGRRRKRPPQEPFEARIESLTQDGRGVAHLEGKAVFVHGALPGERVLFTYERIQRRYDEGRVHQVLEPSPDRVEPRCAHFGVCGGCSLQHLREQRQIDYKQQALLDALQHIGAVQPQQVLEPLVAGHWGYRRKARLGVKHVVKKGKVLVGFRERGSAFVTDLGSCAVLHPRVGERLPALSELVEGLSVKDKVPQVEVSMGDEVCVLIFRLLAPPSDGDLQRLRDFGKTHDFAIYLQEGGPDSVRPLDGAAADLDYSLPAFDMRLRFLPQDFTQVNLELNRLMVDRALAMLDPQPHERVLDLFCGMGNFTLPLATRAGQVTGVEGDAGLVQRARANAEANGLANTRFHTADLYGELADEPWLAERFDKLLLDPPRSGAAEVLPSIPKLGVQRILYISCYPSTLARDAGILVQEQGFRLVSAGVMDMFPHTAHVESIALFERR
jgi:23S rRNA (uracil1939-C5)-methyltransferase